MRIALKDKTKARRGRRVAKEATQTLSIAAQMALLCPIGLDSWIQRELVACFEPAQTTTARRR